MHTGRRDVINKIEPSFISKKNTLGLLDFLAQRLISNSNAIRSVLAPYSKNVLTFIKFESFKIVLVKYNNRLFTAREGVLESRRSPKFK